ncbi:hypothetical protein [Carbonactinospora thermoautotrophica]|uniref:hypothetical protein n=1 Tax=Carbonactinospora thermoautotrophica TaxID=1469144 RepID=UPI00226D7046|nr:hypothetical protein [Carbonactinospora thermoautotrophica]
MRRALVGTTLGLLLTGWAAAPVAALEVPDGAREVRGSTTQADAPSLIPGESVDEIAGGETKWYRLEPNPKLNLYLAVSMGRHPDGQFDGDKLEVQLRSTADESCASDSDGIQYGESTRPLFANVSRVVDEEESGSCVDGDLLLGVTRTEKGDPAPQPLRILYVAEPGLVEGALTPSPAPTEPLPVLPDGEPERIEGGLDLVAAPRLESGVYADVLKPGETRYYRVPLGWGQRLAYEVRINDVKPREAASAEVKTLVLGPLHGEVEAAADGKTSHYWDGELVALRNGTPAVEWGNRTDDALAEASLPGYYFIAVSLDKDAEKLAPNGVKTQLKVRVVGEEHRGPRYQEVEGAGGVEAPRPGLRIAGVPARSFLGVAFLGVGAALTGGGVWQLVRIRGRRVVAP